MFSRILVANRGEIALRVLRACREMGIEGVAVFSEADRDAPYLKLASKAICIGSPPSVDSYLKSDRIIAAATVANVDAIHPGYGFLAENEDFAEQCRASKIEFIGPSSESIRMLGDKTEALKLARRCRVPTVPGSNGALDDDEDAVAVAAKIGYPVMIKAAAGGGGRGIRVVHNEASLRTQLRNARQEAEGAFKDGRVYIEKFVENPRHVEVQVIGDQQGHLVHLFERDCTVQRRHQKLIEETPCPVLDRSTREEICRNAVKLCKAANYYSAGTVEFLLDRKKNFYFLEVNTRIQVEHPITELCTGVDLIKAQIMVAMNKPLEFRQKDIVHRGAAIECRINAEDPANKFRPCPGRIETYRPPGGPGVRLDTHVCAGYSVPPNYDSLLAKLIAFRANRVEAMATMRRCLDEFEIGPIATTIPLHRQIFDHDHFRKSEIDTGFLERMLGG